MYDEIKLVCFYNLTKVQECTLQKNTYIYRYYLYLLIIGILIEVLNCCPFVAKNSNNHIYVHVYTGEMNANNFNNSTACISSLLSTIFTYLLNKFLEKNVIDFSACYSTVAVLITGRKLNQQSFLSQTSFLIE